MIETLLSVEPELLVRGTLVLDVSWAAFAALALAACAVVALLHRGVTRPLVPAVLRCALVDARTMRMRADVACGG